MKCYYSGVIQKFFHSIHPGLTPLQWRLLVILYFSICSFPGLVANKYSEYRQATKIESVISGLRTSKRVTSLRQLKQRLIGIYQWGSDYGTTRDYLFRIISYHNRLVTIRIDEQSGVASLFEPFSVEQRAKIIPESSEQDPFHITAG